MKKDEAPKSNFWKNIGIVMILLIVAGNSWLIWKTSAVVERVDKYNQGVVDELGSIQGDVTGFAQDLNEIRRFLLLPERNYSVDGEVTETKAEDEVNNQNSLALFAMLDGLVKEDQAAKNKLLAEPVFTGLFANQDFLTKLGATKLGFGERGDLQIKFIDLAETDDLNQPNTFRGQPLYNLVFDPNENLFKVQSALGEQKFAQYTLVGFPTELIDYMSKNKQAVRQKKLLDQQEAAKALTAADEEVKKLLESQKLELQNMVKDPAFVETLATLGLKVKEQSREENNKYIFDIVDGQGLVKFSLALEITSGMIKVIKDNQEIDLKTFLEQEGSKKKP
jgi:hypothetical protein